MKKKPVKYEGPTSRLGSMWSTPQPPRWYAEKILALDPRRHEEAFGRVPEGIRAWVMDYVESNIALERCRKKAARKS